MTATGQVVIDYNQFYVYDGQDGGASGEFPLHASDMVTGVWTGSDRLAIYAPRQHGLATVIVAVSSDVPSLDLSKWDNVVDTSLRVPSGTLVVDSWDRAEGKSVRIEVTPAVYRVRVMGSGFDEVEATEEGDTYALQLWRESFAPPRSLKVWSGFSRMFDGQ